MLNRDVCDRGQGAVTLLCTVRGCGARLSGEDRRVVCPRGHSFDVARSGYINLLQPQDRRSRNPGDSKEAARARRRFLERGFADPLVDAIAALVGQGPVLDAGCGEGHQLEAFRRRTDGDAHGVDISVPAIDLAARKFRECRFVVANADRFLPYADGSFAAVSSITARMNAPEFRRVLRGGGIALIAVAGADDLIELREAVLGEGTLADRSATPLTAFAEGFDPLSRQTFRTQARLDAQAIEDVMTSSYRAMRTRERQRLLALGDMDVTLSRDVFLFRKRG